MMIATETDILKETYALLEDITLVQLPLCWW